MKVDMVMPQMGESIAEGTIVRWVKKEGDLVEKDENILEISTDKVDSEIPSPAAGRIVELKAKEGETVPVGAVVAVLETEVAGVAGPTPSVVPFTPSPSTPPISRFASSSTPTSTLAAVSVPPSPSVAVPAPSSPSAAVPAPTPPPAAVPVPVPRTAAPPVVSTSAPVPLPGPPPPGAIPRRVGEQFFSPLVRSMARTEGISIEELAGISGSGRGGRVTKEDLTEYLGARRLGPTAPSGVEYQTTPRPPASAGPFPPARGSLIPPAALERVEPYPKYTVSEVRNTPEGMIEVVPMDVMRQRIAEHMVRSKATSPHVASVTEVDMTSVVRFRQAAKEQFAARYGFKLTFTPFIVAAAVKALQDYPMLNSSLEGTNVLIKRSVNMGVAVALEGGLIVPVVKHAEEKNFLGLARSIQDLAARARSKKLLPEDVHGGTFAVTNMGGFGNLFGIPIINQPNVGILGAGAIVKRPWVIEDNAIAVRDIMYLSLSYDHRVVDGALGGRFLQRVRAYLEQTDLAGVI